MFLLVIGGSGSGKSEYAERRMLSLTVEEGVQRYYIATMIPYGREGHERVQKHQAQRAGRGFQTVERYTDLTGVCIADAEERKKNLDRVCLTDAVQISSAGKDFRGRKILPAAPKCDVLLECISNLLANEMFDSRGSHETAADAVLRGVDHLREISRNLVVVTNDVFSDGMIYDQDTEQYIRNLGQINQRLAELADEVVEVVYSVPVVHKKMRVS